MLVQAHVEMEQKGWTALSGYHSRCHGSHLICRWETFSALTQLSSCSSTANSKLGYLLAQKQRRNDVPRPTETAQTGQKKKKKEDLTISEDETRLV